jgi:hypothetical protein
MKLLELLRVVGTYCSVGQRLLPKYVDTLLELQHYVVKHLQKGQFLRGGPMEVMGHCKNETMSMKRKERLQSAMETFDNINSLPTLDCDESGNKCNADYGINGDANGAFARVCQEEGGQTVQKRIMYECHAERSLDQIELNISTRDCMATSCSQKEFCSNFELNDENKRSVELSQEVFLDVLEDEFVCTPRSCATTDVDRDGRLMG